ncbi:hypothetical protein BGZ83_002509 [Gryganskiella cystojenkinii]|nr:hypothetical protein BGZ83_002509 [Gryganskiella cystojenkinii]
MAQPNVPKLGFPCIASTDTTVFLVGLQYDSTSAGASPTGNGTSYTLQSYTTSNDKKFANVDFFPIKHPTQLAKPSTSSRMVCAADTSGTLLYIFNDSVYLDNAQTPTLGLTQPVSNWDVSRGLYPQVAWSTGLGQFQWLGLSGGNWTTISISAAKGVSDPVQAQVPADIPTTDISSIIREASGSFVVIYNKPSPTIARFNLTTATTPTSITFQSDDMANIGFLAIAHAQDPSGDYFFGSSLGSQNLTFTSFIGANENVIVKNSTRLFPTDKNGGAVPHFYDFATATMFSTGNALVYGGRVEGSTNTWSFGLSMVNTNPTGLAYSNYTILASDKSTGMFSVYNPATKPATVTPNKSGLSTPAIIGIAVGAVALLILVAVILLFNRRNKKIEKRAREQDGLDMAVRDLHAKGGQGMGNYQPRFASTHSLIHTDDNGTTPRGQNSVSTDHPDRPVENLTLRVPIVRYDGRDVPQSVPNAPLGAVVLSQYRLGQTAVSSKMVVIQLGENVDTAESVTLKWVRDEIVWQREAAMLNHIVNPSKIISLHQTMIIPAALEWRHVLVLDAHDSTLDFMLSTHQHRLLNRSDQVAVAKALLRGLVWCHEKDVVHLSICTGSLVLNEEGQWVIWSFGGSRFLNEAVGPRQGSVIGQENGTVERNLAPELLNARREMRLDTTLATTAMDAWAAGCVLFEVLTGQPLFRTEDAADQAATGRFNAWKDRLVDIRDPRERSVVEGLLVLDPNNRLTLAQAENMFV